PHGRRQPDDHVGAVDGRVGLDDRRARPRSGRAAGAATRRRRPRPRGRPGHRRAGDRPRPGYSGLRGQVVESEWKASNASASRFSLAQQPNSDSARRCMELSLKRLLDIPEAEVTPEELYLSRREFMRGVATFVGAAALVGAGGGSLIGGRALAQSTGGEGDELLGLGTTDERTNTYEAITTYNNFYEFGYDKSDPSRNSGEFVTTPWTVTIDGLAENTGEFPLEELVANFEL